MHLPRPHLLPTFFRELLTHQRVPREPEPDLVMDDPEAVAAYAEAGRIDGPMAAYYLFHSARATQVLRGCRTVLDLGCGPATQLAQIAELNPGIDFTGVDLSREMLDDAEHYVKVKGLPNVGFLQSDITALRAIPDSSVDGVISTMALHHLPTREHLRRCFQEIARVRRPGGALYLVDFGALKSLHSIISFAYLNAKHQPYLFSRDYERSLRAAFRLEDFQECALECLPDAVVVSTFKMPILVLVKSADQPISVSQTQQVQEWVKRLPARPRGDLEDLRLFFRMGGLGDDPFSGSPFEGPGRHMAHFLSSKPIAGLVRSRLARLVLGFAAVLRWSRGCRKTLKTEPNNMDAWVRLAMRFRNDMGALKGPWMKFGQMLSYLSRGLPDPALKVLAELQDRSPALEPQRVRAIVESELGQPLSQVFSEWRDIPLAAASIAQLHWARLTTGEEVVVKVKYPGIEGVVRADMSLLCLFAPYLGRRLALGNPGEILRALRGMVEAECDLRLEADHQRRFLKIFADDPVVFTPRVYDRLSTRNIMTMEYVEGQRFAEFKETASQEQKNHAAEAIARCVIRSFHRHCFFNADPHPGNYLFTGGRVCFLDFGFSKQWLPEFVRLSKRQSLAGLHNDVPGFAQACRDLGYELGDRSDASYGDLLKVLRRGTYGTWLEDKPFRFTRPFVNNEMAEMSEMYRRLGPVRISPEHLPLHRVFMGHHFLFADLEAEVNVHAVLVPLLTQDPEPAPLPA